MTNADKADPSVGAGLGNGGQDKARSGLAGGAGGGNFTVGMHQAAVADRSEQCE